MLSVKLISKDLRGLSSLIHFTRNVNFRSRNPPEPHYDRKRMVEVCKPIVLPDRTPDYETCTKLKVLEKEVPHPYEVILSKELKKYWDASRMILFYHLPPLADRTQREVRNIFFKQEFQFHAYSANVMKLAVSETPYKSALHLYDSNTAVVFSETIAIGKLLKINRKIQQQGVAFLAGIIDDVFYSKNQVQEIGELFKKDCNLALAQFLDYVPSKIKSTLNYQTETLSSYLSQVSNEK